MRRRGSRWLPAGIYLAGLLPVIGRAPATPTVAQKYRSGKNVAEGKSSDCGQTADAKFALGDVLRRVRPEWSSLHCFECQFYG